MSWLAQLASGLLQGLLSGISGIFFKQKANADAVTQGEQKASEAVANQTTATVIAEQQALNTASKKPAEDAMGDGSF